MPDINKWLERKYANLEAQTAAESQERAARANLMQQQAAVSLPAEAAERYASAGLREAEGSRASQQAATLGLENQRTSSYLPIDIENASQIKSMPFNQRLSLFRRDLGMPEPGGLRSSLLPGLSPNIKTQSSVPAASVPTDALSISQQEELRRNPVKSGFRKGTTKVVDKSGEGSPTKDTVPAMLAEGEAVLNVGAAEIMGRDKIRELNKRGLRDMKMDDGKVPAVKKDGRIGAYKGVSMVPRMKYSEGTDSASTSGHGTPDSPAALNAGGVVLRKYAVGTENVSAWDKIKGAVNSLRGAAAGPAAVPAAAPAATVAPATTAAEEFAARRAAAAANAQNIMGLRSVPVGTQLELFPETQARAAAAPASAESLAARQAAAIENARVAMGESASTARSAMPGGVGSTPTSNPASGTASTPRAFEAGKTVGRGLQAMKASGQVLPAIGGALAVGNAVSESPAEFLDDPNVPVSAKLEQLARSGARSALPLAGGIIGSGIAPVAGTVGGAALGTAAASSIDAESKALKDWRAARGLRAAEAKAVPSAQSEDDRRRQVSAQLDAYEKAYNAADARENARAMVALSAWTGNKGAQELLGEITKQEATAASSVKGDKDTLSWLEGIPKRNEFVTTDDKGKVIEDKAMSAAFGRFVLDAASQQGIDFSKMSAQQKIAVERQLREQFDDLTAANKIAAERGGKVSFRGGVKPVGTVEDLSFIDSFSQPYSAWQGLRPWNNRGVVLQDQAGNRQIVSESDYTKSLQNPDMRDVRRQTQVRDLREIQGLR